MTREQIEKAANIEMLSHYADEEYPCGIKDIQSDFIEAFSKGAQWRINSVWHDLPNDLPQKENTWILLELIFEDRLVYLPVEWVNDGEEISKQVTRWAYIDDLLPERKEETNGGR